MTTPHHWAPVSRCDVASLTVTVLGSCGAWPEPGRACSGLVVEADGAAVLLDLGWGTLPRLLTHLDSAVAAGLEAVVITHDHPDHTGDLAGLLRARWYAGRDLPPLPLFCPSAVFERLAAVEKGGGLAMAHVFDWRGTPDTAEVGAFHLSLRQLPHYVDNVGVRVTSGAGTIAYTGDTGPDDAVAELGRDADVFIVDATDRHQQDGVPSAEAGTPAYNLTAAEAGQLAERARARRLLLTHFWPGNHRERSRQDAAAHFSGDVLLADEGLSVTV
ncbi:hypothetical protein VV02_25865 [Luteipulveratus mongoliensis]|uniref:Metallo-beta-lactamase domain-containing protein n=2 Tax=Luteipulveratus mongoliensis TaxID=571913 RepID=A0A0K1JPH4_9MICO|nr:hypothetical protein VV02_00035 [Luteipulveratus mongoliensis]AKU19314.1 hypothetical protein VV02_25865 [Luteipulveratus mongoliensis]